MEFIKMHGLGNDFVFLDRFAEEKGEDYPELARRLCHRNFGVGGDGLIIVLPSEKADARMRIINSDGSEAEMCGNGIRCFARYIFDQGYVKKDRMNIETLAGVLTVSISQEADQITGVRVDMGEPILEPAFIPVQSKKNPVLNEEIEVEGLKLNFTAVSMGNPHCIIFIDHLDAIDFEKLGPAIEKHPLFPRKTNVEFVEVQSPSELEVKVWERGVGPTLACGTGACASAVAAVLNGKTERKVSVKLPGGVLQIEWKEDNRVLMTGPADYVFRGELLASFS